MTSNLDHQGILEGEDQARHVQLPVVEQQVEIEPRAKRRWLTASGTLLGLIGLTYLVPGAERFAPWRPGDGYIPFWNVIGRELLGQGKAQQSEQAEVARLEQLAEQALEQSGAAPQHPSHSRVSGGGAPTSSGSVAAAPASPKLFPAFEIPTEDTQAVAVGIEAPAALNHFYGQLTLTELGLEGAITRASQWGDSVLGGDGVTSAIRRRLQARFGDAGHGFHALGRYNLSYVHQGVRFNDKGGWRSCEIIFKCESDGRYGYAGVSSRSSGGGTSRFRTAKSGFGSTVSRFEFWYAKEPDAGRFQLKLDGKVVKGGEARADVASDAIVSLEVPDGEHELEVRAIGGGAARGYGVVLERDEPGVVWDELSLIGSFTQRMDYQDPEHIAWQVKQRDVDLMVFMFGGNDVQRETMDLVHTMVPYEEEYTRVIEKFRAGRPGASCLIMSLMDHGERVGQYGVQTRKIVPKLVASQQKVALTQGCAFFNTYQAMGGKDSIGRWYNARPQLAGADFSHPTVLGQELIANLLYRALMRGYADFRTQNVGKPLPELELPPARSERLQVGAEVPNAERKAETEPDAG